MTRAIQDPPGVVDERAQPPGAPDEGSERRPRVLILGGGFAGVGAARELKDAEADVVLVDKHNYHTFQPLLYQLATDLLERDAVGHPLRDLFHEQPNLAVHQAAVTAIDLDRREVHFDLIEPIAYDYLVLALGAQVNFFGTGGASEHAFPMYTLPDAVRLQEHILRKWETADRDPRIVDDGALNIVVVGGGPTGVESAGALGELYQGDLVKDFPDVPPDKARITLVEAGPELFGMFKPNLRRYAADALAQRGVDVLVGQQVASITPTRVTLKSGKVLQAHTLVWGAGLQAHPIATSLGVELERGNRIPVGPILSVGGRPEVFAVGDIAWITDTKTDHVLPQLGSVALQAGEHAGKNIASVIAGKDAKPFEYKDKGTMATIGRGAAVIQFHRGKTMKGKTAFLAWGAVHLALLSTGEDRTKAMLNWTWSGFTHERPGRISVDTSEERDAERQPQEAKR
jgi:NADH:ubiquinone reductase (H+-translocating)